MNYRGSNVVPTRKEVLVFNTNPSHTAVFVDVLRNLPGIGVTPVTNCVSALRSLSEGEVDAIICDVELGEMDGWRFVRLIRSGSLRVRADVPIILVSSTYSDRIAEATAKTFEANYFLPYDQSSRLPEVLDQVLRQERKGPPRPRLLVIEDYGDTVNFIRRVLGERFEIDAATTGPEGLALWSERRHDLVLLDVMLPGLSGNDVLEAILKIDPNQSVVMMTAHSSAERAGELILRGAVDFIAKPFLAEQLRKVCEIAEQRQDFIISNQQFLQHQEALYLEKEKAQITLQSIADGIITTDAIGQIDYMNPVAETLSGWSLSEARGKPLGQILNLAEITPHSDMDVSIATCLQHGNVIEGQHAIPFLNREGREIYLDHIISPMRNRRNDVIGTVMAFRDVSESYILERRLEYQAKHDTLTGLTNRSAFEDRLMILLDSNLHHHSDYSLCYIDLDQFKVINDTCGHTAGDVLLRQIKTIILRKIRRNRDTLARFGGDEFVLLLEDCPAAQAVKIAQGVCDAIQKFRFSYDNRTFSIGASIGVVPITSDFRDVNEALRAADNACYIAKEKGRGRVHLYHAQDHELIKRHGEMHVVTRINQALEDDSLALFFQTIAPIMPNEMSGNHIEILIRMRDDNGAWISPGFFLPAAERYNLASRIDRWVLTNTLAWFAQRPEALENLALCSINLSGLTFRDDSFIDFVKRQFIKHRLPADKFCFEITETAAISNLDQASEFVSKLKELGCYFALDDFGSGMSSYAYLKSLPVDYLKIDGIFIRGILDDAVDHAMVRSINEIGHVLGLKTIAEFVETDAITDMLRTIGIDFAQGYAISRPQPITQLAVA